MDHLQNMSHLLHIQKKKKRKKRGTNLSNSISSNHSTPCEKWGRENEKGHKVQLKTGLKRAHAVGQSRDFTAMNAAEL